jgi:hypothetical protein
MRQRVIPIILLQASLLLFAGCAHPRTIYFKTVNMATGQPLAGVNATWAQDSYDLVLGVYRYGPTNLPPSSDDGIIVVNGVRKNKGCKFIFSKNGYAKVYGFYRTGDTFARAEHIDTTILDPKWDCFIFEGPMTEIFPTNGLIVIQMKPQ